MNIRHTFALLILILMLPVALVGVIWMFVKKYFIFGEEAAELFMEEYSLWADKGNQ